MDPIANLREQIALATDTQAIEDTTPEEGISDARRAKLLDNGQRLAELVLALDQWRRNGGFDPHGDPLGADLRAQIRDALHGDSNDGEHDALAAVAERFAIAPRP